MYSKSEYRSYFQNIQSYVKITKIINEVGDHSANYSRFMKGPDFDIFLSIEKCELYMNSIEKVLKELMN